MGLNLAYFHYTYKNVQLRSSAPSAPVGNALLLDAASEHSDGVDGDFSIAPFRGFVVNGSFEYLDARFDSFPGTTITAPRRDANDNVLNGVVTTQNVNLAGYHVAFAPPVSATLDATYTLDTPSDAF